MPTFSGKYEFRPAAGSAQPAATCRLSFDEETLRIASDSGAAPAFDLGDVDAVEAGDYQILLKVYDGSSLLLTQLGKVYQNIHHDLLESWRKRLVQCLLLEDLQEVTRVDGFAQLDSVEKKFSSPAEIRLYRSNIAILPAAATAFQWRLADVDAVEFDTAAYALTLRAGNDRLTLGRMARRTQEFAGQLRDAMAAAADKTARVLHALFPFLAPDQFCRVAVLMKEGRVVPVSQLTAIHPLAEKALIQNAVTPALSPYFNRLKQRAIAPGCCAGFKLIRKENEEEPEEASEAQTAPQSDAEAHADAAAPAAPLLDLGEESLLCWFFFPLKSASAAAGCADLVAWECTSHLGRATYVFRGCGVGQPAQIGEVIQGLNRGIVMVNFRREPIYLSDNALEIQPRYRRYAIAQRNIAALKQVRQSLIGRAIHTSPDAWQHQLDGLIRN